MQKLSVEEIRRQFESGKEFNEIFDAFEQALVQKLADIELYRLLFWNNTLTPDELCLFGEKLAKEFPPLAYDSYMWLANVFEVEHAPFDNHELALEYYRKASQVNPASPSPYLEAAACYEPDLNIPPVASLIDFLKKGVEQAPDPKPLIEKLISFYEILGNDEMSQFYKRKLSEGTSNPDPPANQ